MSRSDIVFDQAFFETLKRLELVVRLPKDGGGEGERMSRRTGAGIEYADWRPYAPGDDIRSIDWRAEARSGRLYVRLRAREEASLVGLLIDASGSMRFGRPSKFTCARRLAAAIAAIALNGMDEVSLALLSDGGCDIAGPFAGSERLGQMLRLLDDAGGSPGGRTDVAASLGRYLDASPRQGTLVVISDFWSESPLGPVLGQAAALGYEGALIQIVEPAEIDPGFSGRIRMIDTEDSAEVELEASDEALAAYREEMDEFRHRLAEDASKAGFGSVTIPTGRPLEQAVLTDLASLGLVATR